MTAPLVTRTDQSLRPDPRRVLAHLFVPGQELMILRESRATGVLARILALQEEEIAPMLDALEARYAERHRNLLGIWLANYRAIAHRVPDDAALTDKRKLLLGACFTNEYAIEGAALFNPSAVAHPDQTGVGSGSLRIVLSLRAVGEGHLSSVEFRSGILDADGTFAIDEPGRQVEQGTTKATPQSRDLFAAKLAEEGASPESASYLIRHLPETFDHTELELALIGLTGQLVTRRGGPDTAHLARRIAHCSYEVTFPAETQLHERVLWPQAPSESRGIEDVRLARFVDADGGVRYLGTYTAFDGERITPQLLETVDFRSFQMTQLTGPSAKNKGMAIFPRLIGGKYVALSRWDRENNWIATSPDGRMWGEPVRLHAPNQLWELIHTGNCGPPIETPAGWLVLTHGVGPMREYGIGAILLDLEDPARVIGRLNGPLLVAEGTERDGYVPNVVYSCGGIVHAHKLFVPYGASDASVRFALVDLPALLKLLTR